ncbi:hypothetical protein [Turneriella parva]|uniref:Uncharacterized protein n=1 Tax=Turneriella parva (strain ATCC BAA-1111 / DSM 21527 / NCTC 11395 / H) TaxID=869212 RepID=I4B4C2_TURPD|nr:hypothetical protein [Turneriella parva]AFM12129.1 hypothetical protein Turpa_1481 [Turneriella parva DSM 21527]
MLRKVFAIVCLCGVCGRALSHQIQFQTGRLKQDIAPSADFGAAVYRHKEFRVGAYTAPSARGVMASFSSTATPFLLEVGQRERSLDFGFLISNGAYLPWTRNFAFAEPAGVRLGYQSKYLFTDSQYYQLEQNNVAALRVGAIPASWVRFSAGAAAFDVHNNEQPIAIGSLQFGAIESRDGFAAGLEMAGPGNLLASLRYDGGFSMRAIAFERSEPHGLASGVFEARQGFVGQLFSKQWFAQYFATGSHYAMLRYAGAYLTGVVVYEQRNQLAGFSVRNSETGFHLRTGATLSADSSLQTLAGLGYADYLFVGGGHYQLYSDQPLEPIIFPSEWYSSILLQSSSMRIKNSGYKIMALVNTGVVQGFVALTYAEDSRQRENFGFFMRLAGSLSF